MKNSFFACIIAFAMSNCGNGESREAASADSTYVEEISSSIAEDSTFDNKRKFIKTVELKFRVKNTLQATQDIEAKTKLLGGFMTYSDLNSEIEHTSHQPLNNDSMVEITSYTVLNNIKLRVPTEKLDTALKLFSMNIDHLDYRKIKAEDVALQLYAHQLTQKRNVKSEERILHQGKKKNNKVDDVVYTESFLNANRAENDNALVSAMTLNDLVDYSTVEIDLYQRPMIKKEIIVNQETQSVYKPSFGEKLISNIMSGWNLLESILLGIVSIWSIILLGIISYFAFRYLKK
jgi:hypothetical protein